MIINMVNRCPECGKEVTKENVSKHIFGDCEGKFLDGSEAVVRMGDDNSQGEK